MQRRVGRHIYRLTQIITGHGYFGDYLCKIGREAKANCFHCEGQDQDSTSHSIATRSMPSVGTGADNPGERTEPLPASSRVGDAEWGFGVEFDFCESVMIQKEGSGGRIPLGDDVAKAFVTAPPCENGALLPETGPPGLQTPRGGGLERLVM